MSIFNFEIKKIIYEKNTLLFTFIGMLLGTVVHAWHPGLYVDVQNPHHFYPVDARKLGPLGPR